MVARLTAQLKESQAVAVEKERQLSEVQEAFKQKFSDAEVTLTARCEERETAVRQECELERLRAIEALRQQIDKERERWYEERREWKDWKAAAEGEKQELLLMIREFRERGTAPGVSGGGCAPSSPSSSSEEGERESLALGEGDATVSGGIVTGSSPGMAAAVPCVGAAGVARSSPSVVTSVTTGVHSVPTTAVTTPIVSSVPVSTASVPLTGDGVIQSVTRLLEAQTQVVAKAMIAQSFKPLSMFSGENEEEPFERWLETFEDRVVVAGWTPEQKLYQLKSHLQGTALQVFRLLVQTSLSTR